MKKKIGLFFGSFDPIHNGHIQIINNGYFSQFHQIWFIVTPESPFKKGKIFASFYHRFEMVKLSVDGNKNMIASDVECQLSSPYYTANTLSFLKLKYSNYSFEIIMGSDNYVSLRNRKWYKSDYILNNFRIIVYPRGEKMIKSNSLLTLLPSELIAISATDIRLSLLDSDNIISKLPLPSAVQEYIKINHLYSTEN